MDSELFSDGIDNKDISGKSIFNNGNCWFERDGDDIQLTCLICNRQIVSTIHPRLTLRPCTEILTVDQARSRLNVDLPSIVDRLGNFGVAILQHLASGMKSRTTSEIHQIFHAYCSPKDNPCLYYSCGKCLACGCFVSDMSADEWLNKIAWEDEHCPKGFW